MKLETVYDITQNLSNAQKIELAYEMMKQVRSYCDDNMADDNNYASQSDRLYIAMDKLTNYFIHAE